LGRSAGHCHWFLSIAYFHNFSHAAFYSTTKKLEPTDRRYLLFPILAGVFTAFDFAFWNSSLKYTSAANATLLGNTAPLWVDILRKLVGVKQQTAPAPK
jgi:drug/metabolite transporter (DMT)-like permease